MNISKKYISTAIAGLAYYIFIKCTGSSIPCPFHYLTGYKCPGCGITTMLIEISNSDWQTARQANVFLFYTLPALAVSIVAFKVNGDKHGKFYNIFLSIYALALIGFGVYRNIVDI